MFTHFPKIQLQCQIYANGTKALAEESTLGMFVSKLRIDCEKVGGAAKKLSFYRKSGQLKLKG